ncbi:MAG: pyridoxal phosphate-dependent aminotransferase [Clostridia bacterium]|nr:pyridoxal phosphate-dependent aminotransferase [Clostridia bacterium]
MLSKLYSQNIGSRSVIRECFEYSKKRAAEIGAENVFDFSIGNPSVPPPPSVDKALEDILKNADPVAIHGYPSAEGIPEVRAAIAENLNERYGTDYTSSNIFMTIGAAADLKCCVNALTDRGCGDEIITFAPYFPEYNVYMRSADVKLVVVPADIESFQINFDEFEKAINEHTRAVLINSPNNPSGAVYSEETIRKLAEVLTKKQQEYGRSIYIISDEPYREIVFKGFSVPYVPHYYDNTLVCYSYSKSLSIPGERIGYVAFTNKAEDSGIILGVLAAAARDLGYVGVPTTFQGVIKECAGDTSDLSIYEKNKDILYKGLISMGYTCVEPGGTFYAFPRSLEPDASAFCEKARKYDLVLVPGDGFGCPGHVRIAYCTDTDRVERSLEKFKLLAQDYGVI